MISRRSIFSLLMALPLVGRIFPSSAQAWGEKIALDDDGARALRGLRRYAAAGEHITCENGHFICEFARDVNFGEMFDPNVFANWQQPAPQRGTMHIDAPCKICGAYWFKGTNYHFGDGWR